MTSYHVYGLIDPRDGKLFYIGCTKSLTARIASHRNIDWVCSSAFTCRDIKAAGLRLEHKVFGEYADKITAKWHERELILSTTGLVNKTRNGVLSFIMYPPEKGLEYAIKRASEVYA